MIFFQYIKAFEESTRKSLDLIFHAIKIVHFTSFPRFEIEVLKEFSLAILKLGCRSVRHGIVHHIEQILLGGVVFREYNCMNIKIVREGVTDILLDSILGYIGIISLEMIHLRDNNRNHVQVLRLEDFGDFPKVIGHIATNARVVLNKDEDAIKRLVG